MKKIFLALLFILLNTANLAQNIPYAEVFQINSMTYTNPSHPTVFNLTQGKIIVCWGSNEGIYAQLFDQNLNKIGSEFKVNTETVEFAVTPKVANLSGGKFVISWGSIIEAGENANVCFQLFDANALKLGSELQFNFNTEKQLVEHDFTSLSNDNFVIPYVSGGVTDSASLYFQIFDESGNKIGDEIFINKIDEWSTFDPSITVLNNDRFVVCWQNGYPSGIFAQIYNNDGTKVNSEILASNEITDYLFRPVLCSLDNGDFVIIWEKNQSSSGNEYNGIYGQVFNEDGMKIGEQFKVDNPIYGWGTFPVVCPMDDGGFLVTWFNDGIDKAIFNQMYNSSYSKEGKNFIVHNAWSNDSDVSSLNFSRYMIVWSEWLISEQERRIFGKYYLNEPLNHDLKNFNILEPILDATIFESNPIFKWEKSSDIKINFNWELTYDLYIDDNEQFLNPLTEIGIEDTTYQIDSLIPGKTYYWKVLAKNISGDSLWSSNVNGFYIDPNATDIKEIISETPTEFKLFQNYPNPFNPTTIIKYTIPAYDVISNPQRGERSQNQEISPSGRNDYVSLIVYNVLGKEVETLVNKTQPAGNYEVNFDGTKLSSGVYYYQLKVGNFQETKKMVLLN